MKLLKLAVKNEKWDFVAHTIVFATARSLNGGKPDAGGKETARKQEKPRKQKA